MKKTFLIFALCIATFASAQITLEKTFDGYLKLGSEVQVLQGVSFNHLGVVDVNRPPIGPYIVSLNVSSSETSYDYNIYDFKTLNLVKTLSNLSDYTDFISRGIFTTDEKWAWAYIKANYSPYSYELFIVTEDNTELLHVNLGTPTNSSLLPLIIKVENQYKLMVFVNEGNGYITQLYSLPGHGDTAQDVIATVAPRSYSRKVLKKDQVLIKNNNQTYTLQGQEVK